MIRDNKIRIKYKKPEILKGAVPERRQCRSIHCCPIENDVRLIRIKDEKGGGDNGLPRRSERFR